MIMIDCCMPWERDVMLKMSRLPEDYKIYLIEDIPSPDDLSEQAVLSDYLKKRILCSRLTTRRRRFFCFWGHIPLSLC